MSSTSNSPNRSRININTSISKQMYSFSNSPRFQIKEKLRSSCYYNIPSLRNSQAASFGKGFKTDFAKISTHKTDVFYNQSNLHVTSPRAPSYSFGFSKDYSFSPMKLGNRIHPEPATYNIPPRIGNDGLKYSIRKRVSYNSFNNGPGPGAYKSLVLNPKGYYPVSSITNSLHMPFSFAKDDRFKPKLNEISPTPATYNIPSSFNGTGVNILSYKQSAIAKSFGSKPREIFNCKKPSPGPGAYAHFSDFGGFHSPKNKLLY